VEVIFPRVSVATLGIEESSEILMETGIMRGCIKYYGDILLYSRGCNRDHGRYPPRALASRWNACRSNQPFARVPSPRRATPLAGARSGALARRGRSRPL